VRGCRRVALPMRTWRTRLALLAGLAVASAPVQAQASPQDVASTHAAIVAGYALARAAVANIAIAQSKIEAYDHRLAAECPGVGRGALENESTDPMSHEVASALWSIAYGSVRGPIHRFASAVRGLRWTNGRFTRTTRTLAANLTGLASIPPPDLCADIRTWTAGGFATVPQRIPELNQRVERLEVPEVPWGLVAPFVLGSDAGRLAYIKSAERKTTEAEFTLGQHDWYQVLETLGLPP
jgi:hypothetical protein